MAVLSKQASCHVVLSGSRYMWGTVLFSNVTDSKFKNGVNYSVLSCEYYFSFFCQFELKWQLAAALCACAHVTQWCFLVVSHPSGIVLSRTPS